MNAAQESITFSGKLTSILGCRSCKLKRPMKPEPFGKYVARIMRTGRLSALEVERRAKVEAEARGLEETHKISDSSVNGIINDESGGLTMPRLIALAWGLGRPLEEVVGKAFGFEVREEAIASNGDLMRIWELQKALLADEKKYFTRQIEDLVEKMQDARDAQMAKKHLSKSESLPRQE